MNRFYLVLSGLLVLGGVAALIGQAWGLGVILTVIGLALLAVEIRTGRRKMFVPLESGPDAAMERTKAQGLQNMLLGGGRPTPDPPPGPAGGLPRR